MWGIEGATPLTSPVLLGVREAGETVIRVGWLNTSTAKKEGGGNLLIIVTVTHNQLPLQ